MLFTMNIPFQRWMKLSKLFLLGSFIMLPMAFLFEGVNGAHRWINLKVVSFQPSELAMLSIILYVSFLLSKKQDRILDPKASFWPSMVLIGYGAAVILVEPDMGTAVIFATAPFVVMCTSGIPKKYIRNTVILGIAACVPLALMDYRGDRMSTYMNPWAHQDSLGLQTVQSLYAISNGGWFGRGLGHSIEKFSYLPEPHTDFIFAIISEEWGFVGAVFLIGLFAVLIWRGIHIATHVPNRLPGLQRSASRRHRDAGVYQHRFRFVAASGDRGSVAVYLLRGNDVARQNVLDGHSIEHLPLHDQGNVQHGR